MFQDSALLRSLQTSPRQVELQDLEVIGQRPWRGLPRHVVQAGTTVDSHQDQALRRRVSLQESMTGRRHRTTGTHRQG